MKCKNYDEVKVPSHAVNYLVNGVKDNLKAGESEVIDQWFSQYAALEGKMKGRALIAFKDEQPEAYFTSTPAFGLPCDCYDMTIFFLTR